MAHKFLVPIDLAQNELQNARVQNLGTPPATPKAGQIYFDSASHGAMIYDGTKWRPFDAALLTDGTIKLAALEKNPLARANHTGTQAASTISDLEATVKAYKLSDFAAPTTAFSAGGQKITNLGTPTAGADAATKQYVDDAVAGLSWKDEVKVATTANVSLATDLGVGKNIDGVALVAGDRVLVKNQTAAAENGIYVVPASGAAKRAEDANTGAEISGATVFVSQGTTNSGQRFVCNTPGAITLGTTAITFVAFGGGSSYTAGHGLALSGNTFSVRLAAGSGLSVGAGGLSLDPSQTARKFSQDVGGATSVVVTHNLNSTAVVVQAVEKASKNLVSCDVQITSANTVTVGFAVAPAAGAITVTVVG